MRDPLFIVVDLFCGAGGTSTGFHMAANGIAEVIACVNHDPKAIRSHHRNYPDCKHFTEDMRTLDLAELVKIVKYYQAKYPNALLILWASLECTNFSKAKGGQPRDADSRTLADYLDRYVEALNPDYVEIENVVEFMAWGPLDANGKPVSKKNGQDWMRWRKHICSFGYTDEWQELNSANFGAYTSRNRLFGVFAKPWLPIVWPAATHAKNPSNNSIFGDLQKWMPVRDVIDLDVKGKSIIHRRRLLADRTIKGIIKGINKFISEDQQSFLYHYYGKSCQTSISEPCSTLRTKQSAFLVQAFLHNPAWGRMSVRSLEDPSPVLIARADKAPLRITSVEFGSPGEIPEFNEPHYKELKKVMIEKGISDIFYRPIKVSEALSIQGFPPTYYLEGNQEDAYYFIGNSVVPHVVKCWIEALANRILETQTAVA